MQTSFSSGSKSTFVVPDGVTSITWTLVGAPGGICTRGPGTVTNTKSGKVVFTMAVTPGATIWVRVGGKGTAGGIWNNSNDNDGTGGYNGGGDGGSPNRTSGSPYYGAGGGGRTDIRYGTDDHAGMVGVAGASGGGAATYDGMGTNDTKSVPGGTGGGPAGYTSNGLTGYGSGYNYWGLPAVGATPGAADGYDNFGAGAPNHGGLAGTAAGVGGRGGGNANYSAGGGGGGGYAGGGGGSSDDFYYGSGGGAGSNFVATSTAMGAITGITKTVGGGVNTGNGSATASYKVPPLAPTSLNPQGGVLRAADTIIAFNWTYQAESDIPLNHFASDFRYRKLGASTWTTLTGVNTDTSISDGESVPYNMPANTLLPGFGYEWQVRTRNTALTTYGPWSASAFLSTALTPNPPTWLSPVNGETLTHMPVSASWNPNGIQTAWQMQQLDTDGVTVLWDSGVNDYEATSAQVRPIGIGITGTLRLRINNGLSWSNWASVSVTISLTATIDPPPTGGIELEVYDGITGAFIDMIPNRLASTFLDERNGPGAGSFTVRIDDPILDRADGLIKFKNFVRVKIGGDYVGAWVMTNINSDLIDSDEGSEEVFVISGVGLLGGWWGDAAVYPESGQARLGVGRNVQRETRMFGFASSSSIGHWYDISQWSAAVQLSRQDNATKADGTHPTGNPWAGGPASWPSGASQWLWWRDPRAYETSGLAYFRREFTVAGTELIQAQLTVTADSGFIAFLDGNQLVEGSAWQEIQQSDVFYLDPGLHTLGFVVAKDAMQLAPLYTDPAGLLFYLAQVENKASGQVLTTLVNSSSSTLVSGYPGVAPGWTPGDILARLYKEAKDRGVTAFQRFKTGFSYAVDSYGQPWHSGEQWVFEIGEGYSSVADKMSQVVCDIWFDEDMVLRAAPNRGVDRAYDFAIENYAQMIDDLGPAYAVRFGSDPDVRSISVFGRAVEAREVFDSQVGNLISFYDDLTVLHFMGGEEWGKPMLAPLVGETGVNARVDSSWYYYPNPDSSIGGKLAAPFNPVDGWALEFWASFHWSNILRFWAPETDVSASRGTGLYPEGTLVLSTLNYDVNSAILRTRVNLCTNPSFETNTTGWTTKNNATIARSTAAGATGLNPASLLITFSTLDGVGALGGAVYVVSGLTVGQQYTVASEVWRAGPAAPVDAHWHLRGGGDGPSTTPLEAEWQLVYMTFTATATSHTLDFVGSITTAGGHVYMDAVRITLGSTVESYFEGTENIYQRQIMTASWTGEAGVGDLIERYVSIPTDETHPHHYVAQVVYGGGFDFLLVFRDGQQIVSLPIPSGFRPGWFNGYSGLESGSMMAEWSLFETHFDPDDIVQHYQAGLGQVTTVQPMVFQKGKNVLNASSEQQFASVTSLLSRSSSTYFEVHAREELMDKYGRIEGFFDGSSKSNGDARSVAHQSLRAAQNSNSTELEVYGGYTPWRDFGVGDWVLAPRDRNLELTRRRIESISYMEDSDSGRARYAVELDTISQSPDRKLATWLERVTPTGSLGGFIANAD